MSQSVKLSKELIAEAASRGRVQHRSIPRQIEYWANIGKIAEENPDLTLGLVIGILQGLEDSAAGDVSEYEFG